MKTVTITSLLAIFAAGIIAVFTLGFAALGWHNQAAGLKNQYEMKIEDNKNQYDLMWKKIKQTAQIPDQQKEAFADIFNSYAQNRSGGGEQQIMTWIKEAVPNVDLSIYNQLMNIVAGSRDTWTMKQTELVSIAEQHNAMLVKQPQGFVLAFFGHQKLQPKIITSTRTEETFVSGQDDDISLK